MSTDPSDPLTPSTADGPDRAAEHPHDQLDDATRASNPNSAGRHGLSGDMGVSSERTGPAGPDHRGTDISGTGSKGGAVRRTDGAFDTSPTEWDQVDVSQRDVNPMPEGSEQLTGATADGSAFEDDPANVDRTVGEPLPNPIADEKSRRGTTDTTGVSRAP